MRALQKLDTSTSSKKRYLQDRCHDPWPMAFTRCSFSTASDDPCHTDITIQYLAALYVISLPARSRSITAIVPQPPSEPMANPPWIRFTSELLLTFAWANGLQKPASFIGRPPCAVHKLGLATVRFDRRTFLEASGHPDPLAGRSFYLLDGTM